MVEKFSGLIKVFVFLFMNRFSNGKIIIGQLRIRCWVDIER